MKGIDVHRSSWDRVGTGFEAPAPASTTFTPSPKGRTCTAQPYRLGDPRKETDDIRSFTAAVAATIALLLPAGADAKPDRCRTHDCFERVAIRKCSQARPRWCVERAIVTYRLKGWHAAWMRRVPGCESGWNAYAVNGGGSGSSGLYQFMPGTWQTTPYRGHSIFSAKYSALAAAWMIGRAGRSGEWVCR